MSVRRPLLTAAGAAVLAALLLVPAGAHAGASRTESRYEIGLLGDMPYGDTGRAQYPNVVADLNRHHLAFSAFDGDLKNGSERCDEPLYDLAARSYASFRDPLVYVPGDNEWTDCDRAAAGGYDPNERLALVRTRFAAGPRSLGKRSLALTRQSARYPENVRWSVGGVTYVGLNVPGSDNNATSDPTTHYADTKTALAREAIAFGRPVVLVNGDSHVLRIDKPLTDKVGNVLMNVTRVQTFGSAQNHWVSATVDVHDPEVFTFHQHVITANEPAYVAP
jgi:hypothetical protein